MLVLNNTKRHSMEGQREMLRKEGERREELAHHPHD
jgi:hypothetical protein